MGRRGTASMGRVGRSRARRRCGSTVEQLICNQWVAGSIPVAGTTISAGRRGMLLRWPACFLGTRMGKCNNRETKMRHRARLVRIVGSIATNQPRISHEGIANCLFAIPLNLVACVSYFTCFLSQSHMRSAIWRLLFSIIRAWVLPWIPLSGRYIHSVSPPAAFKCSYKCLILPS